MVDGEHTARGHRADLPAGRVGRAHGLDGSFYVTDARHRLLAVGMVVSVGGRKTAIARLAGTAQRPIVRLEGVEDREAARALHGLALTVDQQLAPALAEGEWWAEELEGCTVVAGELTLGTVTGLVELPSCEALEVRSERSDEAMLVPMVRDAIRSIAIADRRIEVDIDFLGLASALDPAQPGSDAGRGGDEDRSS